MALYKTQSLCYLSILDLFFVAIFDAFFYL